LYFTSVLHNFFNLGSSQSAPVGNIERPDRRKIGLVSWSNARIDLFLWPVLSSATDMERDGNEQPRTCEIV
jgi:hypothetical protein